MENNKPNLTLVEVYNFLQKLDYYPTIYKDLNDIGLNPYGLYLNKDQVLSDEQMKQFMLLKIKHGII
jgi:hypothetical protein